MRVHLVDGTYELFRYHYAPNNRDPRHGATVGVLSSMLDLVGDGATHVGVATDHVIESFRNELWPGYKTGAGVDPDLYAQFPEVEEALVDGGFCVWPMVEFEADDALAAAAAVAAADERVQQVLICTPDKDLGQCVTEDGRIVQYDRRKRLLIDRDAVIEKFGVPPESIPDYLALVGDSADGFPGLKGWGAKSTAAVLARYGHIEDIPPAAGQWEVAVRGAAKLAATLQADLDLAVLFRRIATVERDAPTIGDVAELEWTGPTPAFAARCQALGSPALAGRAEEMASRR